MLVPSRAVEFLWELRPAWQADGLCLEYPEVTWFPERGQSSAPAKDVCARCLVQRECLEYALADPDLMGVWGGTSMREREHARKATALHEVA